MSIATWARQLFERRKFSVVPTGVWRSVTNVEESTGVAVTGWTALQSVAVFACIRALAESTAALPLVLYRRLPGGGKEKAVDHPLYSLLRDLPNPEMTSIELRETLMGHLGSWGNAYGQLVTDQRGRVTEIWPLRPDRTEVRRANSTFTDWSSGNSNDPLVYIVTLPSGEQRMLRSDEVWHIRGLGSDGVMGYSPIGLARRAVALALVTEQFGATFFGNGARPGVVLKHPKSLSPAAKENLRTSWETMYQGVERAHRVAILEEGMEIETVGVPPEDAQFLATRQFQVADIARLYRIPPHIIGDLERSTNNNIEHQGLEFVTYTLQPWLVRFEQGISRDLLLPGERGTYFAEHLVNALLRGDVKSRFEAYALAHNNGWLSANDIREMENMNPIEGGDLYLVPLNMVPVEQVLNPPEIQRPAPEEPPPAEGQRSIEARAMQREARARNIGKSRVRLAASYERVFRDAIGRVIRRETADVRRAVKKNFGKPSRTAEDFLQWLLEFYAEHRQFWKRQILPVLLTYADSIGVSVGEELGAAPMSSDDIRKFIEQYVEDTSWRETDSSYRQLRAILRDAVAAGEDPEPLLDERLDGWDERRADELAEGESRNSLNAFGLAFYTASRTVRRVRWLNFGDSCAFCKALDGKVVGLEEVFIGKGEELTGEGSETLSRRTDIRHPPLHRACDCMTVADL